MSAARPRPAIGPRPSGGAVASWVRQGAAQVGASPFTARLTIDVTPALRGRIKVAAFRRGVTAAAMLRELLAREFPQDAS